MDPQKPVRMCICARVTFAQMKAVGVASLEDARARFGGAAGCGTCAIYISKMLTTGETEFEVVAPSNRADSVERIHD